MFAHLAQLHVDTITNIHIQIKQKNDR
jgi:hypothetical protein